MLDPSVINPEILEFIMGITTGFLAKKGEVILEKSTDKISDFLKKKLGKDELQKIKGLSAPEAKRRLEELIKDKNLVKEVHTFYVIYKYLEKFTADSVFLRVMDFRRGEGLPLDQMYVKLRVVEEKKEKEVLDTARYYDEEYYYKVRKRWERSEGPSKTIDPDDIMDMNKGLVCILGLPGAGKTTLCKYFCWKTLKGEYTKQGLPIYVELRGIRKEEDPVTYALYSKLKEHFTKEEIEKAVAAIKHNTELFSPLFIFDGLDEVKVDYGFILESIRNCADSSLCVVTSRRSGFIYMQHDRTCEILPLEWEEKKGFADNYFTYIDEEDKIDPFLQVLEKKEYDSLSKNPMLLSILCALASDEKDVRNLPSRKSGLYKRIVVKMNEWHKSKGGKGLSREEIRNLEDLALKLFRRKPPRILFEKGIDENILDRAAEVGIVHRWDELRYSFLHLTLQEYFAARSLKSLKRKEWEKIIRKKKDAVAWYEIIQFFASILNEENKYGELEVLFSIVLESPDILHLIYALAGHCLAEIDMDDVDGSDDILRNVIREFEKNECKDSFVEASVHLGDKAVDLLIDLLQRTDNNFLVRITSYVLGTIGDPRAVGPLLDVFEKAKDNIVCLVIAQQLNKIEDFELQSLLDILNRTDDRYVQINVAFALSGGVRYPKAVDPLIRLLSETDDSFVQEMTAEALGALGDPRAVDPLIDVLEKTDSISVIERIVGALRTIRDPRAVEPLMRLSSRIDDNYLQERIVFAFCSIGNPETIEYIVNFLEKTEDTNLMWRIAEELGKMGDVAIQPLLDHLEKTECRLVQRNIAHALGEIGDSAIQPLIDLLKETEKEHVHSSISEALGMIGDSAIHPLIDLLKKTDKELAQRTITHALSRIGGSGVADLLIELLRNTKGISKQKSIIRALGTIGDPIAVDPLIGGLDSGKKEVQMVIVWALGMIGDPKAVEPLVKFLERTEDNSIQAEIAGALGEIKDKKALVPLLNRLDKTVDSFVQLKIASALGRIGDPKAIDPLLNLLETDDRHLQANIGRALVEIGDSRAVDPLADLIKSGDKYVKYAVAQALGETENPKAFKSLMYLFLELKDRSMWEGIIWKLAETEDPRAIESLINLLIESKDSSKLSEIADALSKIGDMAVQSLIDLLEKTQNTSVQKKILFVLGRIGNSRAVGSLLKLSRKTNNSSMVIGIVNASGKIGDPEVVGPLIDLLKETQEDSVRSSIIGTLERFSPYWFYECSCIEENAMLPVLCHFSTEYNIRFFKDKIVLPEGEVLCFGTDSQKEQSMKKLDKIINH